VRLNESTIAKLGLVALALVQWRYAALIGWVGLMPAHPIAVVLVLVLYASSFALLLRALRRDDEKPGSLAVVASFALIVGSFAYWDALVKLASPTLPTIDGHAFMDVSARMLLDGRNPYQHSLLEAFRVYRMPLSFSTPFVDGDVSDRAAYPALSFLVLVPFVLAHIPTYLAYAAFFIAALSLVVSSAPWWARALVLALFTFNETFLAFSFGGVTDTVWALCLVGVVLTWKRPKVAALLLGLACAYKQHAWFVAPFLVARLCHETQTPPWKGIPLSFLGRVVAVFALVNVPFVLWGAGSWLSGVLEPLTAPMVQLSDGLTALSMTGYVSMPRQGTSLLFWTAYALALFIYVRHPRSLRDWCWALPGVVLWLGYRSLMSYWYFYALTAVAALLVRTAEDDEVIAIEPSWRLAKVLAVAYGAAVVAFVVGCAARRPPFELAMQAPFETWDTRIFRVHVRVTNASDHETHPRFSLQSNALQPFAWIRERGADVLAAGARDDYVVRAPRGYSEYGVEGGARFAVSDDGSPSDRAFVDLPRDLAFDRIDAVPNGTFAFVETRTKQPLGWVFEPSDASVVLHVEPSLVERRRVGFSFAASTDDAVRYARLQTTLALPDSPITLTLRVSEEANRPPFDRLYGLRIRDSGSTVFILFGDEVAKGRLPTGEVFTSISAPRGEWNDVRIVLRDLLERVGAPLVTRRFTYGRARDVDVPTVPLDLALVATVPDRSPAEVAFGAIRQDDLRPVEALAARGAAESAGVDAWHGAFEIDNGNYAAAVALLERAVAKEPSGDRLALLGTARYLDGRKAAAVESFDLALGYGPSTEIERALGWALIATGDFDGALAHFTRGHEALGSTDQARLVPGALETVRGLALAATQRDDCAAARVFAETAAAEDTTVPPPSLGVCDPPSAAP
jgi:uncharacterized membrane protein